MDDKRDRVAKATDKVTGRGIRAGGSFERDAKMMRALHEQADLIARAQEIDRLQDLSRRADLVRGAPAGWDAPFDQLGVYRFSAVERAVQEEIARYESMAWGGLTRAQAEAAGLIGDRHAHDGMATAVESAVAQARALGSGPLAATIDALSSIGSLAPLASGLAYGDAITASRIESLLSAEALGRMSGTASDIVARDYGEFFPAMRAATASEMHAVLEATRVLDVLKPYPDWKAETEAWLGGLHQPWIAIEDPDRSIEAMAKFSALTRLVDLALPSSDAVITTLRDRLGDYRDDDMAVPDTLDDPIVRVSFQIEQGFDTDLSALPRAIVATMLAPTGRGRPAPPADEDDVEIAVNRMVKRVELALRQFLVAQLQRHHGDDWMRRVPSGPRRAWEGKRRDDIDAGRAPAEPIHYADIDHYRKIIESPDNWNEIFQPIFKDAEAIRETLRRIALVRNPSSHFRAVSVEDLIILRAECVHLGRWLGITWES